MMNILKQLLGLQPVLATIISAIFLILLLMDKDELEELALNNALKLASIIIIISLLGYSLYALSLGYNNISINIILSGIEGLCILTLLFYYMDLKGISFEVKIRNQCLTNILIYISIIISFIATVSILFEFEFFENKMGFIRYDELILFVNVILASIIIPLNPKKKRLTTRSIGK